MAIIVLTQAFNNSSDVTSEYTAEDLLKNVTHLTHSTIKISGEKVVYFGPIQIKGELKGADIIFITHTHDDHFSIENIKKLAKSTTTLVLPQDGIDLAKEAGLTNIVEIQQNTKYTLQDISFKIAPTYNIDKEFHT